jgi:hypothetical protein
LRQKHPTTRSVTHKPTQRTHTRSALGNCATRPTTAARVCVHLRACAREGVKARGCVRVCACALADNRDRT